MPDGLIGDARRLRQVIINLLDNALKFTSAGKVSLSVTLLPSDRTSAPEADEIDVHFSISDTGPGIPEEMWPELLTAFSQTDTG